MVRDLGEEDFWCSFWVVSNSNFLMQLAFLTLIVQKFDLIGYTPQEFGVLALAWQLSQFAVPIYYLELRSLSNLQPLLRGCLLFSMNLKSITLPPQSECPDKIDEVSL